MYYLGLKSDYQGEDGYDAQTIFDSLVTNSSLNRNSLGVYFQELYYHIPELIAHHLNSNQQFKHSKYWFEKVFDPTADDVLKIYIEADDFGEVEYKGGTKRVWQYLDFRNTGIEKMSWILGLEKYPTNNASADAAISKYKADPFNPYAIARYRLQAYPKAVVLKYVDNLLDWADSLFAQYQQESINEALMLYVMAQDILGERPRNIGKCEDLEKKEEDFNYTNVKGRIAESEFYPVLELSFMDKYKELIENAENTRLDIDVEDRENTSVVKLEPVKRKNRDEYIKNPEKDLTAIKEITATTDILRLQPVFCIPRNKDIVAYWERVEQRLYNIRNCRNINGEKQEVALFAPEIDPMLLVRARAAGLSIEDALASLNAKAPAYRFVYILEKTRQLLGTLQGLGGSLLSAMEKKDGEELTLLRARHEQNILRMTSSIKKKNLDEAKIQKENLTQSRKNTELRRDHYKGLIEVGSLPAETQQQVLKAASLEFQLMQQIYGTGASISYLVAQLGAPTALKYGGKEIGDSLSAIGNVYGSIGSVMNTLSEGAGMGASTQRRDQDWQQQLKTAEQELKTMDVQLLASDIRIAIAERDLAIHEQNIEQSQELYEFYKDKFTKLGLYNFMSTQLNRLYRQTYNLAIEMARTAERCYQLETGRSSFLFQEDQWASEQMGLLAGERLTLTLHRLEKEYIENNYRDIEITQSFSLRQINPIGLLDLRAKGECNVTIPEAAYDLIYPGHYRRIIKSVRVSIPCIVGPYTNVGCQLSLQDSKIRYEADKEELQAAPNIGTKLIATSNAQNDGGQFDLNFKDERYLPFEGAGAAESQWALSLPTVFRSFDYNTISDVIIHISYSAKFDEILKDKTNKNLKDNINTKSGSPFLAIFDLKHDFPNEWHQYTQSNETKMTFKIDTNRFPYFVGQKVITVGSTKIYEEGKMKDDKLQVALGENTITLDKATYKRPFLILEYTI